MLQLRLEARLAERVIEGRDLAAELVDTTVKEKTIIYPIDSKLYLKSLLRLTRQAKAQDVVLRQSYNRTGKVSAIIVSR